MTQDQLKQRGREEFLKGDAGSCGYFPLRDAHLMASLAAVGVTHGEYDSPERAAFEAYAEAFHAGYREAADAAEALKPKPEPFTADRLNKVLADGGEVVVGTMTRHTRYTAKHAGWFTQSGADLYVAAGKKKNCLGPVAKPYVGIVLRIRKKG